MRWRWLFVGGGLLGCAPAEPGAPSERAWLVAQLTQDNQRWLTRDHTLLATKLQAMEDDPYDFMRGSVSVFFADLQRPREGRPQTSFLREAAATEVLLIGDPHPENFGTFLPAGAVDPLRELRIDVQDLDAAVYGPWWVDLRRAAVGLAVLLDDLPRCAPDPCQWAAVGALVQGYAAQVLRRADGGAPVDRTLAGGHGALVDGLLLQAAEEGAAGERLARETTPGPPPSLRLDEALDRSGSGTLALTGPEAERVDALWALWSAGVDARQLDAARVFGRGVASLPAERYVVLWQAAGGAPELLLLREVVDPPVVPGLFAPIDGVFDSAHERVPDATLQLWSAPGLDPSMGGVADGGMAFKSQAWSSYQLAFDHGDLRDEIRDGVGVPEVLRLGELLGRLLADAHCNAPTLWGEAAAPVLAEDLAGREALLSEELVEAVRDDAARSRWWWELLAQARAELGPLLGAARIAGADVGVR